MPVDTISSRAEFRRLRDDWQRVFAADHCASVFLSWQWLDDLFERRDEPVHVLAWRRHAESTTCDAFCALRARLEYDPVRRRFGCAWSFAGNDWADHTGLLCTREDAAEAIPALVDAAFELPWRKLRLNDMRVDDERLAMLEAALETHECRWRERHPTDNQGATRLGVSPVVDLPDDFEQWLGETLGSGSRQRVRRFRRRLDADPALSMHIHDHATPDAIIEPALEAFRRLWAARWRTSKGERTDRLATIYARTLRQGLASAQLVLPILYRDGFPVAMIGCYLEPEHATVAFFVGARDIEFSSFPAGLLLHARMIETAIERGYRHYDLLRGDERYKYALGATDRPLVSLEVRRRPSSAGARLLPPECRDAALGRIDAMRGEASVDRLHALHGQLLESWPGEPVVLTRYRDWLAEIGATQHADAITRALTKVGTHDAEPEPAHFPPGFPLTEQAPGAGVHQ